MGSFAKENSQFRESSNIDCSHDILCFGWVFLCVVYQLYTHTWIYIYSCTWIYIYSCIWIYIYSCIQKKSYLWFGWVSCVLSISCTHIHEWTYIHVYIEALILDGLKRVSWPNCGLKDFVSKAGGVSYSLFCYWLLFGLLIHCFVIDYYFWQWYSRAPLKSLEELAWVCQVCVYIHKHTWIYIHM